MSERDKTLLPELLPGPQPTPRAAPAERVGDRAQRMLARFKGIGATAGAALLTAQCSGDYRVVDPLPPPPNLCSDPPGGQAGPAADVGWVDSTSTTAVPAIDFVVRTAKTDGGTLLHTRVERGTITSTQNSVWGRDGAQFELRIQPDAADSVLRIDVELACTGANRTHTFWIVYRPPNGPFDRLEVRRTPPLCVFAESGMAVELTRVGGNWDLSGRSFPPPARLTLRWTPFPDLSVASATVSGGTITSTQTAPDGVIVLIDPDTESSELITDLTLQCGPDPVVKRFSMQYRLPRSDRDTLLVEER